MGARHRAGGAAGLPRSIEAYALPRNCAIERSEAGGGFDGALPSGAKRLLGIIQRARRPRVIFLPTSRASVIDPVATRPSATSARSRWRQKQPNPVLCFGGR